MRNAAPAPVHCALGAWKTRIAAIMRELAERHEGGMASASGLAAMTAFLAARASVTRPVLVEAARRRVPGRN
jgi:hypothetical protein